MVSFERGKKAHGGKKVEEKKTGSSHATNVLLPLVFFESSSAKVAPPFEKHRVANKLEPRREFEGRVGKHALEFIWRHVLGILDFIRVGVDVDIGLDEQNVVD